MNSLEKLEEYLKTPVNSGESLPNIRYFSGINMFCTPSGDYKGSTLEESITLFLESK